MLITYGFNNCIFSVRKQNFIAFFKIFCGFPCFRARQIIFVSWRAFDFAPVYFNDNPITALTSEQPHNGFPGLLTRFLVVRPYHVPDLDLLDRFMTFLPVLATTQHRRARNKTDIAHRRLYRIRYHDRHRRDRYRQSPVLIYVVRKFFPEASAVCLALETRHGRAYRQTYRRRTHCRRKGCPRHCSHARCSRNHRRRHSCQD